MVVQGFTGNILKICEIQLPRAVALNSRLLFRAFDPAGGEHTMTERRAGLI